MIDSSKLLPNRVTITLSKGSVKKVALIERKLILIDSLLKQKLLLSKVREGIRRQEEERIKRTQRELSLEKEDEDKDDLDSEGQRKRKPKDPKDGGGASLVGSALIGAAGVSLAKNAGLIIGAAKAATILISGGIALGIGIAKVSNQFDNLQKSVASFGPAGSAAVKVSNAFLFTFKNFVSAAILVGIFNAVPESKLKIRRGLAEKIRKIGKKKVPTKVVLPEGEPDFVREIKKIKKIKVKDRVNPKIRTQENLFDRVGRKRKPSLVVGDKLREGIANIKEDLDLSEIKKRNIRRTLLEAEEKEGLFDKKPKVKRESFLEQKPVKVRKVKPEVDLLKRQKLRSVRMIKSSVGDDLYELAQTAIDNSKKLAESELNNLNLQGFTDKEARRVRKVLSKNIKDGDDILNKIQKNLNAPDNVGAASRKFFSSSMPSIIEPSLFERGRSLLSTGKIFPSDKSIKSLSGLLEAFGGIPLVKATRKFLGNTIGKIPILGDLLGFLLDVFVFKEPVGRAVFMAAGGALGGSIGAWLGGILGTAVPVVGNLAGAVVGGFLGGVGGDMLGGFLYDQIIGKQQKPQPISEKAIKSSTKGLSKLGLNGGGLVPNLAMQGGGMTPDVGSFASYEDPRGRVAVKTILLPLNSESDESNEAIVTPMGRSSRVSRYEKLYKGGLA